MATAFRKNDYGNTLTVTILENGAAKNISAATTKTFSLQAPDGRGFSKTAVFVTDGSDGQLYYTIEQGLLTQVGVWKVQAVLTFAGAFWQSSWGEFGVGSNLPTQ